MITQKKGKIVLLSFKLFFSEGKTANTLELSDNFKPEKT